VITLLLLEDHASYRQLLSMFANAQEDLKVVAEVRRADEAGTAAAATRPDVAVVDLDLPGGTGVGAIHDIRRVSPGTGCVVLSALNEDVEFGRAIEAGASAVLHKSIDIEELLDVLRAVADGRTVLPAEQTSRRLRALASSRDRGWHVRVLHEHVSPREREVLELLAEGADNRRIARQLGITQNTVQTHIRNLLAKLGVQSRLEAVVKAMRMGLVEPPT
jgi:DNA-binding NarL/FixJ family response regulator